jgi:hypothetical protein
MEAGANASSPVVGCRLHAESAAAHTTAAQKRRMDQTSRPYQACLGGSWNPLKNRSRIMSATRPFFEHRNFNRRQQGL